MTIDPFNGVGRVLDSGGDTIGAGFLITDEGLIATCAHVIEAAGAEPGDIVQFAFCGQGKLEAKVLPGVYYPEDDVAFLRLIGQLTGECEAVILAQSEAIKDVPVRAFGYPAVGEIEGLWGTGKLIRSVAEAGRPVLQLSSTEITEGFSGGPVWEQQSGYVVGMVASVTVPDQLARLANVAFAVPAETLRDLCPQSLTLHSLQERLPRVPFMADDLLDDFVPRPEEFNLLVERLLTEDRGPVGITTALRGAGGYGKTTLATALCHDERVQAAFPDGILWVTLGQEPNVEDNALKILKALTGKRPVLVDTEDAAQELDRALGNKRCLLVIDDVWNEVHMRPFLRGGPNCTRLITTRKHDTLPPDVHTVDVDAMQPEEAIQLLGAGLNISKRGNMPRRLTRLAARLGEWPLLLELVNGVLRRRVEQGESLADAHEYVRRVLEKRGLTGFDARDAEARDQAVSLTMDMSLGLLNEEERSRYHELSVFPKDEDIPLKAITRLWGATGSMGEFEVEELCGHLFDLSLLRRFDLSARMIALHDVVQDYLAQRLGDRLFTSHNRLVEAYALDCQHGADGALRWSTGPDDGYYFQRLVYHLAEAGREEEQNDLLLDLDWLQIKLKNTDVNALLTDYDVALSRSEDEALQLVQAAIRLSAHVLNRDKTQLWSQLYGRLMAHDLPDIQEMLENSPRKPWLRTLVPSLRHAGGALVRTLPDPGEEVKAVAVTPDGDRAILISKDRSSDEILDETPKVWNLECGAPSTPSEAYSEVNAVAVTPDGRLMVVALSDGTLRLLDISDKGLEHEIDIFQGHTAPVWAVGMTKVRDERCAVSASGDRTLKVWSLESHKEIGEGLEGHEGAVWDVAVTPDGQCAVSASGDGTLRVWDLEQQENRCILEGHQESVWAVAVTSDGRRAVSGAEDGTLRMWDLEAESELWKLPTSAPIKAVVMTSDGRYAVSISENGVLEAWDLKREANVCTLESRTPITALAATRDGRCVVSADDKALRIWEISDENLDSDLELPSLEYHIEDVSAVALTGDGGRAISASEDALSVWDIPDVGLKTGSTPWVLEDYGEPVSAVAVTPDGKRAISGATDGSLKVWDIANVGLGQVRTLHALKGHTLGDSPKKGINAVIAMPDDRRAISASSDETLKVWDLEHGIELCTLEGHKGSVTAVAVTLDGKRAVSASSDRRLKIWDIESGMMSYTLEGHEGFVEAVAVTPDGRCAVSASRDQTLKVWDLERGEEICTLDGHDDEVGDVAITPDGHQVISASHDTTLKVWDLERGKELHTLEGHTAWVEAVEVTEDGRYAVSVSRYGTLKVWKLESGKIIATFTAGTGDALLDCAVARDSRTIVAGGRSGQVHILRLEGADGHEI